MIDESLALDLRLENGMHILQRRDFDAPRSAGMLACFGGGREPDDLCVYQGMAREIEEELRIEIQASLVDSRFYISEYLPSTIINVHMFKAVVASVPLEIFEGQKAEAYTAEEILARRDVVPSAKFVIRHLEYNDRAL